MFAKNILQLVNERIVKFESFLVTAKIRKMTTLIAKMHRNSLIFLRWWQKRCECSGGGEQNNVFI